MGHVVLALVLVQSPQIFLISHMQSGERKDVYKVYNKIAHWFSDNRPTQLMEKDYLDRLIGLLPLNATVLDLGCGTGKPIFEYLIGKGIEVVGLDASSVMLAIAKANFPQARFIEQDMRLLDLGRKFDAIIAWHSFFHLPAADQPEMFNLFEKHLNPEGILLFTSGTELGEAWGMNGGENLFHASLATADYEALLAKHHFKILSHVVNDPNCGHATIWMAQYQGF